jgi:hypothetical protein
MIALWGMDPVKFLTTKDDTLRVAMLAVAKRTDLLDKELGERRATQIANAVIKGLSGR